MNEEKINFFNDKEMEALAMALARAQLEGFSESDFMRIHQWAIGARVDAVMLEQVLKGGANLSVIGGEIAFSLNKK